MRFDSEDLMKLGGAFASERMINERFRPELLPGDLQTGGPWKEACFSKFSGSCRIIFSRFEMRILVVEDERRMAELLQQGLTEDGHLVTVAGNGRDGLGLAQTGGFDVVLLDVMLPGCNGFEVARQLRASGDRTPILMLTARDAPRDVVNGLNLGADDYVTKPFSFEVLLARIRAVGRRGPIVQPVVLESAGIFLDPASREVRRGGRKIDLTRTEYAILELLMRNSGRVLTRETLIEQVWGSDSDIESNTLDAFVRLLRGKVEGAGEQRVIQTIRGVGYCLREAEG
jgi:DNA-binding response OmpR family regulator